LFADTACEETAAKDLSCTVRIEIAW
jgi:hypothetical protein